MAKYKQTGDTAVLGTLYERYMELVYGVCLKYLGQPESAQDAVINIYEELVDKLKKHEVANFRAWLHTVAKNHCLMRLRSEKKLKLSSLEPEHVQSADELHLNDVLEKEENFRKLDRCLEQLSEDQRQVVELFYLKEKCYNEISELLGMEWNRVRSHIQNGRRNLKICMETGPAKTMNLS